MKYLLPTLILVLSSCAAKAPTMKLPSQMASFIVIGNYTGSEYSPEMELSVLTSKIEQTILQRGYNVVDRALLPDALKEVKFLMSGAFDQATAIELGKMKTARFFLYFSASYNRKVIRCTDISTMSVVFTKTYANTSPEAMMADFLTFLEQKYGSVSK